MSVSMPAAISKFGYSTVHEFTGGPAGASQSHGSLTAVGDTLVGHTFQGVTHNLGAVFTMNADASDFRLLHSFAGKPDDGAGPPHDSILLADSVLYGMTVAGGADDVGTIYRMEADGSEYRLLRSFSGGAGCGSHAHSGLLLDNDLLYGLTERGGAHDHGVLFRIGLDGSDFQMLHSFHAARGASPLGAPVRLHDHLYGVTRKGGAHNLGGVFSAHLCTGTIEAVHEFKGGASDGATPYHGNMLVV